MLSSNDYLRYSTQANGREEVDGETSVSWVVPRKDALKISHQESAKKCNKATQWIDLCGLTYRDQNMTLLHF